MLASLSLQQWSREYAWDQKLPDLILPAEAGPSGRTWGGRGSFSSLSLGEGQERGNKPSSLLQTANSHFLSDAPVVCGWKTGREEMKAVKACPAPVRPYLSLGRPRTHAGLGLCILCPRFGDIFHTFTQISDLVLRHPGSWTRGQIPATRSLFCVPRQASSQLGIEVLEPLSSNPSWTPPALLSSSLLLRHPHRSYRNQGLAQTLPIAQNSWSKQSDCPQAVPFCIHPDLL